MAQILMDVICHQMMTKMLVKLELCFQHIITIDLLTSIQELLKFLDDVALDVFTSGGVGVFPYKSFGEVVNLVMISMLREVLRNSGEFILISCNLTYN